MSPKFDNVLDFFRRTPRSKITSLLEPTRIMTLLHRPSIHLNKSFTTLKVTFHEIAQAYFLSPNFDNVLSNFFVEHLDQNLPLLEPTRIMTLLHRPSIHLNKSFTTLKVTFHEIAQAYFLSPNFDNVLSNFFVEHLDQKLPVLEPTRIMTLLHRHSNNLNKSFTTLKVTFHEIAQAYFLSPKFDVLSTFFVEHLDQKLPLC